MPGSIVLREIKNNISNLRFAVGMALCIILTLLCVIVLTHDFEREIKDYSLRVSLQDDFLNQYAHVNRLSLSLQKPPEKMRPFVIGIPNDADLGSFDDNPMPVLFPPLDLIFIVTIIMSLLAILFAYDSVTGERETGTLKLIFSSPVSRASVLFGKWVGGLLSLFIPFLLSLSAGALYVTLHPSIQWDVNDWLSFVFLALASLTFISAVFLLGLTVSVFSRLSSVSILIALLLWVLAILVVPNLSPYVAAQLVSVPPVHKIEKETNRILGIERDDLGREFSKQVTARFQERYGTLFTDYLQSNEEARRTRATADPEYGSMSARYRDEIDSVWAEANRIQREKANRISQDLVAKAAVQTRLAKGIACISPYTNYLYIATDLTGTGLRSLWYFGRMREEFYGIFRPYLDKKVAEAKAGDPAFSTDTYLDIRDRPRFQYREEPAGQRLSAVLPYWGILLFFNVLFFVIAFAGFIRYDVR